MERKVLYVENCFKCPYGIVHFKGGEGDGRCTKKWDDVHCEYWNIELETLTSQIPDWCPLEWESLIFH